jgi:hypothetical protein
MLPVFIKIFKSMAININDVYKAVLVILDQNKRGPLGPTEFNKIANQAQQEIYTEYFDELNLLLRKPKTDRAYADRIALLDEKISLFKRTASQILNNSTATLNNINEIGSVVYTSGTTNREAERIEKKDIYTINQSPLTAPTSYYPVYTYENNVITIYPTLSGTIDINYLAFPSTAQWAFTVNQEFGNYVYSASGSTNFDIHELDQPLLITKILGYAGVLSSDQLAASFAANKEQQIDIDGQK